MDEDSPAIALARELTGANQVEAVAYGTEAGHFQRYGIPAVICGPGSIDQAHQAGRILRAERTGSLRGVLRKVIAKALLPEPQRVMIAQHESSGHDA